MKLLLDSHAVYWWTTGSPGLSEAAKRMTVDHGNSLLVSAVSIYEIEFKARRRHIDPPRQEFRAALRRNAVDELAVTRDHAEYAARLEWSHRDPWDRLLAAQTRLENCDLVSADKVFDRIGVARQW